MPAKNFYELFDSNADGYPISQFGTLPEFCKASLKPDDASTLVYLDGWEVAATGDPFADAEQGRKYAEMTIEYARKTGSSAFIAFVLDAITLKTVLNGERAFSTIEYGFFQRLAEIAYCGAMN